MSSRARLSADKDQVKLSPVCTNCREKHLKCTGAPLCLRCKNDGTQCTFVPSRRGMRPSKGRSPTPKAAVPAINQPPWTPIQPAASQSAPQAQWSTGLLDLNLTVPSLAQFAEVEGISLSVPDFRQIQPLPVSSVSLSMTLINNTYEHFIPLYPFALPKPLLLESLNRAEVQHLRAVIEYIGSFHQPSIERDTYANYAERLFFSDQYPQNAYTVQAFLLLAIKLDAGGERAKAYQVLQRSQDCALLIGMNRLDFAQLHSGGSSLQEASWQATWVTLRQLCTAWAINPTMGASAQFEVQANALTTSRRASSAYSGDVLQSGGRRSPNKSSLHHSGAPLSLLATSWEPQPPILPATTYASFAVIEDPHALSRQSSSSQRPEGEYFIGIEPYSNTVAPKVPGAWVLESQPEAEPEISPETHHRH